MNGQKCGSGAQTHGPNITGSHGHSPRAPGAGVSGANTGTQDTAEIEEGEMAMPGE